MPTLTKVKNVLGKIIQVDTSKEAFSDVVSPFFRNVRPGDIVQVGCDSLFKISGVSTIICPKCEGRVALGYLDGNKYVTHVPKGFPKHCLKIRK